MKNYVPAEEKTLACGFEAGQRWVDGILARMKSFLAFATIQHVSLFIGGDVVRRVTRDPLPTSLTVNYHCKVR